MNKRILTILIAILPPSVLTERAAADVIPCGEAVVEQLQKRDSILIADQLLCSVELDSVRLTDRYALPDVTPLLGKDTLELVRGWQADTLGLRRAIRKGHPFKLRLSMVLSPFEEGRYTLPPLPFAREREGRLDTLLFEVPAFDVTTIQVDTTTFVPHDIKGQMRYPLRPAELLPYVALLWLLAAAGVLAWYFSRRRRSAQEEQLSKEPAHIVALKALDRYRGDKYWKPERQKAMYSGITDALRTYIESRFGINAEEMTTAEIFDALKPSSSLTPELYAEAKELFELSDFVKFAKHTASDDQNARAVPVAVRFVTSTYQSELEDETAQEGQGEK